MFVQQKSELTFSREFCNFLETSPNSDQIKRSICDQILLLLSYPEPILWFWWHARFSGLANSGHAQKPFFTGSNEPNIFALPPPRRRWFAWGVHLTKCNPRYWRRRCGIRGTFVLLRGRANPPIHQTPLPPSQSFISISYLASFPIRAKTLEKAQSNYHLHY